MTRLFACFLAFFVTQQAMAFDYRCQIVSLPDLYYGNETWDGSLPHQFHLTYEGRDASMLVEDIGLAGHPELLFSFRVGSKVVLSASQKKELPDYNLIWRAVEGSNGESLMSLACRRPR